MRTFDFPRFLSRRRWQIIAGLLYMAIGMASRLRAYNQPDAAWLLYACQRILDGSLDIWSRLDQVWAAPPLGMALTYPPLLPLLLTPWVAAGQALGLTEHGLHVLIGLPMLLGDVALAYLLSSQLASRGNTRVAAQPVLEEEHPERSGASLGGAQSKGAVLDDGRCTSFDYIRHTAPDSAQDAPLSSGGFDPSVVIFLLCLLTFIVPFSSAYMGHHETLVVLLILLAVQANSLTTSAICWGLAMAAKQTAVFAYVPFALLLLRGVWQERRPTVGELIRFALISVGIPFMLILPFWVAHPESARYALLTVESRRELYGLNVPRLLDSLARRLVPDSAATVHALLVRFSSPLFLVLITGFSAVFALRSRRLRESSPTSAPSFLPAQFPPVRAPLLAAMGATYAAFIVFGKWNDTHYQLMPLMFLLALDLVERPTFPYVYLLFTLAATQFYVLAEPVSVYWRFLLYVALLVYFLAKAWIRPAEEVREHPTLRIRRG